MRCCQLPYHHLPQNIKGLKRNIWQLSKVLEMSQNQWYGSIFFFFYHTIAHTWTHMQGQNTDWTTYFLIKHPPIVTADPWVSLVPALKQQLSLPLPHSSPKCFQWRKKQHLPEGYVHMKFHKETVYSLLSFDWLGRNTV